MSVVCTQHSPIVKLGSVKPVCVIARLVKVALPKFEKLGEVTVTDAIVVIVVALGVITTELAFNSNAWPIFKSKLPTVILKAPAPELLKSKASEKFVMFDVNEVELGNSFTSVALTPTVPPNVPALLS